MIDPITRREKYLAKMAGLNIVTPQPITRRESFLAKLAGMDVTTPAPITREEMFLAKAAENSGTGGGSGGSGGGSSEEWIGDGNTHIWITLHEGRTSPMLGVCPNGTVTVDWGDGTTPDVLTGTSTSYASPKWTPNHEYAKPGDYVITLTVDGEIGLSGNGDTYGRAYILRYSSGADTRNAVYQNAIQKVEIGNGVVALSTGAFSNCQSLASINIAGSVTGIEASAFTSCSALRTLIVSASVTNFRASLKNLYALTSVITLDGVTHLAGSFENCYSLVSITISKGIEIIFGSTFKNCLGVRYYDFTKHTVVPTLVETNAFTGIPADCEIRVPAALYDEWIAATNWATYASNIVAV